MLPVLLRLPRALAGALLVGAAALLGACAGVPSGAPASSPFAERVDAPFAAEGRLSARRTSDAIAVQFRWEHQPPRDELVITSPLGQTIAELSGDSAARSVEVRTADGRRDTAADWATLTGRVLGFPLPVAALASWIRAAPRPGTDSTVEMDPDGRPQLLRQDGWEIVYDYADDTSRLPRRLRIGYPDLEIRVVIDQWR